MTEDTSELFLVCRVLTRRCALPLEYVIETMRPLPVEPIAGAPPFIRGVAIIRGVPVPVADLARVFAAEASRSTRYVTVKVSTRSVALAVDAVEGVRTLPAGSRDTLPPLLRDASADAIDSMATLDGELLVILSGARLVPHTVWSALDGHGATP